MRLQQAIRTQHYSLNTEQSLYQNLLLTSYCATFLIRLLCVKPTLPPALKVGHYRASGKDIGITLYHYIFRGESNVVVGFFKVHHFCLCGGMALSILFQSVSKPI